MVPGRLEKPVQCAWLDLMIEVTGWNLYVLTSQTLRGAVGRSVTGGFELSCVVVWLSLAHLQPQRGT